MPSQLAHIYLLGPDSCSPVISLRLVERFPGVEAASAVVKQKPTSK